LSRPTGNAAQEIAKLADKWGKTMSSRLESSQHPLLGENAYLWTFVPVVVVLSLAVFVICFIVLFFTRARAGFV
jgi:ABC-type multidrug transport system permease subunit